MSQDKQQRDCPPSYRCDVPSEAERTFCELRSAEEFWEAATPEQADEYVPLAKVRVRAPSDEDENCCDEKH